MKTAPSITDLPTEQNPALPEGVIHKGDIAIIIGTDSEVRVMAFDVDTARLNVPEEQMTDEDRAMLAQGQKVFALTLAANSPMLMNILMEVADNPDIIDVDSLKRFLRPN